MSPSAAHSASTRSTGRRAAKTSAPAITAMARGTQRKDSGAGSVTTTGPGRDGAGRGEQRAGGENTARWAITPTTAAVIPVNAAASVRLLRSASM